MKRLVAYFSASGVTARKAQELAKAAGADLFEIEPAEKYTDADLDWRNSESRSSLEMADPATRPELSAAAAAKDVSGYDIIYIGFPVWWGTAPHIINTFIENGDFAGKQVVLFATSGGSDIVKSVKDLKALYPQINITGGELLNGAVKGDIA